MSKVRINSIDVLRVIATIAVIFVHTNYYTESTRPIFSFVVPAFFAVSGYFYCNATFEKKRARMKNILVLTLLSNAMYFVFKLAMAVVGHNIVEFLTESISVKSLCDFIFLNESPFGAHLWFLGALLYCMVIEYFLSKLNLKKSNYIVMTVILFVISLILGKYSLLLLKTEIPVLYVRNFLFAGLPFFLLGKIFKNSDVSKVRLNNVALILLSVFFAVITVVEKYLLVLYNVNTTREEYIGTVFIVICLLIFVLKNPCSEPSRVTEIVSGWGRKYTLTIYIIHPMIFAIVNKIIPQGNIIRTVYDVLCPLIIFAISLICAVIYLKVKNKVLSKLSKKKSLKA